MTPFYTWESETSIISTRTLGFIFISSEIFPLRSDLIYMSKLRVWWFFKRKTRQSFILLWASLVAQRLKPLPAVRETWVRSLSREDPLEKEMATHSSILAWRIPWLEEPGRYSPWGCKELETTK